MSPVTHIHVSHDVLCYTWARLLPTVHAFSTDSQVVAMFIACIVVLQGLRVSEFVMSNELVSMTLAMVSESREVNTILKELFTPEGNELYVHPASRYLRCTGHAAVLPSRLELAARHSGGPVLRCVHLWIMKSCTALVPKISTPTTAKSDQAQKVQNLLWGALKLTIVQGGRGPELLRAHDPMPGEA